MQCRVEVHPRPVGLEDCAEAFLQDNMHKVETPCGGVSYIETTTIRSARGTGPSTPSSLTPACTSASLHSTPTPYCFIRPRSRRRARAATRKQDHFLVFNKLSNTASSLCPHPEAPPSSAERHRRTCCCLLLALCLWLLGSTYIIHKRTVPAIIRSACENLSVASLYFALLLRYETAPLVILYTPQASSLPAAPSCTCAMHCTCTTDG
jgi:hypothetical protein